jgi:hypothetical protein
MQIAIWPTWCFDTNLRNAYNPAEEAAMRPTHAMILVVALLMGCGGNPYLNASLDPAELEGKDKAWFEKNWGAPSGKSPRFFGGETWTYFRIAGGQSGPLLFNFTPNQCQITLRFNTDALLSSYKYSGC